jgi:hypothetical protein
VSPAAICKIYIEHVEAAKGKGKKLLHLHDNLGDHDMTMEKGEGNCKDMINSAKNNTHFVQSIVLSNHAIKS